jgi:hypothetical protein
VYVHEIIVPRYGINFRMQFAEQWCKYKLINEKSVVPRGELSNITRYIIIGNKKMNQSVITGIKFWREKKEVY